MPPCNLANQLRDTFTHVGNGKAESMPQGTRQVPLDDDLETFCKATSSDLLDRVRPYLKRDLLQEFRYLTDADRPRYLPRQPHFTLTWLIVLVLGRDRTS